MELKAGLAVNVEGMSEIVRQAVVRKFESLNFSCPYSIDEDWDYIGIDEDGEINAAYSTKDMAGFSKQITLEDLMFCDQPDEVTHCYHAKDAERSFYSRGQCYELATGNLELICTRESVKEVVTPISSKPPARLIGTNDSPVPEPAKNNWYERGELPPVDEALEGIRVYSSTGEHTWFRFPRYRVLAHRSDGKEFVVEVLNGKGDIIDLSRFEPTNNHPQFRPIKSERDRLIEKACEIMKYSESEPLTIKGQAEALLDAGMLRMPENGE